MSFIINPMGGQPIPTDLLLQDSCRIFSWANRMAVHVANLEKNFEERIKALESRIQAMEEEIPN